MHPSSDKTPFMPGGARQPYGRPSSPDRDGEPRHSMQKCPHFFYTPEESYKTKCRKHTTSFRTHRWAGFTQCAQEVSQFLTAPSEVIDAGAGRKLLQHLGACVRQLDCVAQNIQYSQQSYTPPSSPSVEVKNKTSSMWRPW
ncbi:Hairy orange domain containing protein [Asbolus verrucosus]|uniref:Hairy orange domain containing protein n=1 Tax=Asbolus verrucosus TaxID=1661398 RepID=A0A482VTE6_ASBVE|nr:Hairy orange domain containing protein [Asbolus verrucosus]